MGLLVKTLGAGAISIALVGCGGGNESDNKMSSPDGGSSANNLSGKVMDGYLYKANVCIDKNDNAFCDSADGEIVQTDQNGNYKLSFEGDISSYKILVEAVAGTTIDMDNPGQVILSDFTLETLAGEPAIVSPMTSLISSIAQTTGVDFETATTSLATELSVSEDTLKSDYVSGNSTESKQIHMLARGVTKILQAAQKSSVDSGVTEEHARKGTIQRLASLDVVALKSRTDTLSSGAENTDEALDKIGTDYENDIKIEPGDVDGDKLLNQPKAPKNGVVNDAADTFDWQFVKPYNTLADYEYSLDGGITWQVVIAKPLNVGSDALELAMVQVRVAADNERSITAGLPIKSAEPYTETVVPSAPSQVSVQDANNQFDWVFVPQFTQSSDYEYSIDNGDTWIAITAKPQQIEDVSIAAGELKVRVKADDSTGRPAGLSAKSTQPMTVTPDAPSSPVLISADDIVDTVEITLVQGFTQLSDYQVDFGDGWVELASNPIQIGNVDIAPNTIKIRVKANEVNGRPAGAELVVPQAFSKVIGKPESPTLPVVDNANNKFGWTLVPGFDALSMYEYSVDGGKTFSAVTANPQILNDDAYAIGEVCVRVKQSDDNAASSLLCNDKVYTVTPATPGAPINGVVDDAANTFDWDWVAGFEQIQDYEVQIEGDGWQSVTVKPLTLLDKSYAVNSIEIRVKSNPVDGRQAGGILSNSAALTKQPDSPSAPTSLVVDDTENTLDWSNVDGFSELSDYEWSLNSGVNWAQVTEKPLIVGDIAKGSGEIQIRVRANAENGMPAGVAASNSGEFTTTPQLSAPTNGEIKVANNGLVPNMISWDYVTGSTNYNLPEHYEFTVDQGVTWQSVTSNPQFIGPKAFDKSHAGIRVKADALSGETNAAGQILWTTDLSGQFNAMQYVPMETWNTTSGYSLYSGWNSYDTECVAEYDSKGEGEPTFWAYTHESDSADVFDKVNSLTICGIKHWSLPDTAEVATLSTRSRDTLPSFARSYLISDYSTVWANESGTAVAYKNGLLETSPGYSTYAFVKWQLASGTDLVNQINSDIAVIDGFISQQSTELSSADSFLKTWVSENQNKSKAYAQLGVEAETKTTALQTFASNWNTQKDQLQLTLDRLTFEAQIARSRSDSDSANFVIKVAEYSSKFNQLSNNNTALKGFIETTTFASELASIQEHASTMTASETALQAATTGSAIHQATLDFYAALHDLESDYQSTAALDASLKTTLADVDSQYTGLIDSINALLEGLTSTIALHNIDTLHTTAVDGLNRAHNNGYLVSQADALIEGNFAKLDTLGRYLPASATYAQGWRCVLDTRQAGKQRVWSLLKDGLPGGNDEVVYNAQGADLPSLLGSGGILETANSNSLCGYNDWVVPHPTQLETLATATVSGLQGASTTVDVNVFPNHKALLPEYDKSYYSGGTRFFYWTSAASSSSYQYTYVFANTSERPGTRSFALDGDTYDQYVTIARLVREEAVAWEYLAQDGSSVSDRSTAVCAKNPETGATWQLFSNNTADERYKTYSDVQAEITTMNAGTCGKTNWVLPTADELKALIPIDAAVFPYSSPNDNHYSHYEEYLTSGSTSSRVETIELQLGEVSSGYNSGYNQYLYRFISN